MSFLQAARTPLSLLLISIFLPHSVPPPPRAHSRISIAGKYQPRNSTLSFTPQTRITLLYAETRASYTGPLIAAPLLLWVVRPPFDILKLVVHLQRRWGKWSEVGVIEREGLEGRSYVMDRFLGCGKLPGMYFICICRMLSCCRWEGKGSWNDV